MAVVIEAFTVVIKNEAICFRYPGGGEAFMMNIPNQTFCADESVSRVSFMVDQDAMRFFRELESLGLSCGDEGQVVVCSAMDGKIWPACSWLQLGSYKESSIAWVAGEEVKTIVGPPGWDPENNRLTYATKEEAAKRLKFVRSDGNVQVFWDTVAQQEVYVGRTQVPLEILFDQAAPLVTSHLRSPGSPVNRTHAVELRRAVEMLEIIVETVRDNWRVFWLLGKAWHGLGHSDRALYYLSQAFAIEKHESDISRELSGICLELGKSREAVAIAEHAVGLDPQNAELLGNLALAYLMDNRLQHSQGTIQAALQRNPGDSINQTLRRVIQEVVSGKRSRPRDLFQLTGAKRS